MFEVLRSLAGVVLVAAGTVRAEGYGPSKVPLAIVTRSCRLDFDAPLFTDPLARPLVLTVADPPADRRARAAELADVGGHQPGRGPVALLRRPDRRDRLRGGGSRPRTQRSPNRSYDIVPHAQAPDFDDSDWRMLAPADTELRLSTGRVCFGWYRIAVTIPDRVGDLDPTGATVVFEIVVDDYAEVWVDGRLPLALGTTGGHVVAGFNAPNRVVLTTDARLASGSASPCSPSTGRSRSRPGA